ncbi:hypothetical protein QBC39DRAFT_419728 [Podospora conica]|nr:hypothetical protein QBC39DRAFT_419728 [Schizothecium conicum]
MHSLLFPPWTPHPSTVCPPSQLPIHLPSPSPRHSPWTHPPRCITTTQDAKQQQLCVFTSTTFNPPLGLSIVASAAAAADLVRAGLLTEPPEQHKEAEEDVKYEPRPVPSMGGGVGLFVKRGKRFAAGEVILVDRPTLMVPDRDGGDAMGSVVQELAWQGVMQLPERGKRLTRGLARDLGGDELVDVVDTNAFSQLKGGRGWNLVFPRASRMNHDCVPNAITRTNATTLTLTVVALRNILPGEQIVNSYLDPSPPSLSHERRAALSEKWGFTCGCAICAGPAVVKSDARRRRIAATQGELEYVKGDPAGIYRLTKQVLRLMDAEGMVIPRGEYLGLAAMAARYLGLGNDVVRWARRARGHWDLVMGEGSAEAGAMAELEAEMEGMRGAS